MFFFQQKLFILILLFSFIFPYGSTAYATCTTECDIALIFPDCTSSSQDVWPANQKLTLMASCIECCKAPGFDAGPICEETDKLENKLVLQSSEVITGTMKVLSNKCEQKSVFQYSKLLSIGSSYSIDVDGFRPRIQWKHRPFFKVIAASKVDGGMTSEKTPTEKSSDPDSMISKKGCGCNSQDLTTLCFFLIILIMPIFFRRTNHPSFTTPS